MRNFNSYYQRMSSNLEEKTDFIRAVLGRGKIDTVFDFGCADGSMLESMAKDFPNITFFGYDFPDIVEQNNEKNTYDNIIYVDEIIPELFDIRTMVILSSVLHELFGGTNGPLRQFFNDFYDYMGEAGVFCIRDMYFTGREFDIDVQKQIIETLYKDNYEEEIKEDYNATRWDFFGSSLTSYKFKLRFDMPYKNQYLSDKVDIIKEFETTHRKQVWERKEGKKK